VPGQNRTRVQTTELPFVSLSEWTDCCVTLQGVVGQRGHKKSVLISTDADVGLSCANDGETPLLIHASMIHARSPNTLTCLRASMHQPPCPPGSYMYVHIRSHSHAACGRQHVVSREPTSWTTSCVFDICKRKIMYFLHS
jgi:hypothetical protein